MKLEITGAVALVFLGLAVMLLGSSEVSSTRTFSSKTEKKTGKDSTFQQPSVSQKAGNDVSFVEADSLKKKLKIKTPAESPSSTQAEGLVNLPLETSSDSAHPRKSLEEIPN